MSNNNFKKGEIIIYKTSQNEVELKVKLEQEMVWLSLDQLAILFDRDKSVISRHIKNIFQEEELEQNSTCRKFRRVRLEGSRDVEREIDHYNLDVIISVGYRVNSKQGTKSNRYLCN